MTNDTRTRQIPTDEELRGPWYETRVLEDNAGGLYLFLIAPVDKSNRKDILISGVEQSEDALTDLRSLDDWLDSVHEDHRWYAYGYPGLKDLTEVASYWPGGKTYNDGYRPEGLTIHEMGVGIAARRYLGVGGFVTDEQLEGALSRVRAGIARRRGEEAAPTRLGSGTAEDPDRYVVDEALLAAIEQGRWNTTMLNSLTRWARARLEAAGS